MQWSLLLLLSTAPNAGAVDRAHGQAEIDSESQIPSASGPALSFGDNTPMSWLPERSWSWSELEITGTVLAGNVRQALVVDPFGAQHSIRVGDYVDNNWAQVVFVGPRHVVLMWDTPFPAADLSMCWGVLYLAPASETGLRDPFQPWNPALDPPLLTHSVHAGCGRSKEVLANRYPDLLTDSPHSHLGLVPAR